MTRMSATEVTRKKTTVPVKNVDGRVSFADSVTRATTTAVFEGAIARRKVCMSIYTFYQNLYL